MRLDSVRLAGATSTGADPVPAVVFAATAADVSHVVSAGKLVVEDGHHRGVPDVAAALSRSVAALS